MVEKEKKQDFGMVQLMSRAQPDLKAWQDLKRAEYKLISTNFS